MQLSRMDRVYDFIQDHLAEDLSADRLAKVAIVSPWWFQRIFLQMTRETPARFVRRLRIERAANLLRIQKSSSIGNIARDCGFGSAELMTRHFKNRFGISPSEWRKTSAAGKLGRNRQVLDRNGSSPDKGKQAISFKKIDILNRVSDYRVSPLRLERRGKRRLIYTRHFSSHHDFIVCLENVHRRSPHRHAGRFFTGFKATQHAPKIALHVAQISRRIPSNHRHIDYLSI